MRRSWRSCQKISKWLWSYMVWRILCPLFYRLACRLRSIDPNLIFFVHDMDFAPGDNFRPVMELLQSKGFTCAFYGKIKGQGHRLQQYFNLFRFVWDYPKARAVFIMEVSQRLDICKPRKGTEIIQLWHGCGAFKQWGYSTIDLAWGTSASKYKWFPSNRFYTYTSVSAAEVIPHYAEAFNCPATTIHPWGAPRTDFFFQPGIAEQCRQQVLEAFPEIAQRKIVIYAPTFRGNSLINSRHDDVLEYDYMAKKLGESCALLLKPHPRSRKPIPAPAPGETPFLFDAADMPIERLLCAADLVISDYSSLIFEYSLMGRPMLFYPYDLANYDKTRSFYYPYLDFVPGDLAWDTEDVADGIRANLFEGKFDAARVEAFRAKFMEACDGKSTERIVKNVLGA